MIDFNPLNTFIVSAAFVGAIVALFMLIGSVHDNDAEAKIEEQHTEQVRIEACSSIEQEPMRVLCVTGIPRP